MGYGLKKMTLEKQSYGDPTNLNLPPLVTKDITVKLPYSVKK
jgi:hypothetical protein